MSLLSDVLVLQKIGHYCRKHRIPIIPSVIQGVKRIIFPSCDIPLSVNIGERVRFPHRAIGVIINSNATIGDDTKIECNVCIGGKNGGAPNIGKNCYIGAGSVLLGPIVVGDNCRIGANAVVLSDLPDGSVAVGAPAKIIKTVEDGRPGKKD